MPLDKLTASFNACFIKLEYVKGFAFREYFN